MSIERRLPDEIRVQDLSLEQQGAKGWRFDASKDFSEDDWDALVRDIANMEANKAVHLPHVLASTKIVAPDKFKELNVFDDYTWEMMLDQLGEMKGVASVNETINYAARMKMLAPDKASEIHVDSEWEDLLADVASAQRRDYEKSLDYENLKILKPERAHEIGLDENLWSYLQASFSSFRKLEDWHDTARFAARMRVLYPERFNAVNLDEKFWKGARQTLEKYKKDKNFTAQLAYVASDLTILSAEEVKVTDKGIELVRPQPKLEEPTTNIAPEVKKF